MCFTSESGRIMFAKKDIETFKILEQENDELRGWMYTSHKYNLNEEQPDVELIPEKEGGWSDEPHYLVEAGYHSFADGCRYERNYWQSSDDPVKVNCIIPKGSKYLFDENSLEYVSSNIIIKEIISKG